MLEARSAVKNLHAYHPPLAGRKGLRLDFNESLIGCSPKVLARLRSMDVETLARYPEREPVEAEVASFLGISPAQVLLTNGADEAIHLLCSTYIDLNDEVIIITPTFAMYKLFAQSEGARLVEVLSDQDFSFPAKELLSRINERTRLITIANPNNPTGTAVDCEALLEIADAAPQAAILVDEAYFEFHGKTMLGRSSWPENLFVARTFSKAYGLAGLRIGILVGNIMQMAMLRRVASPYNVNAVALAILPEALRDQRYVENYVAEVRRGRERLQHELKALGLRYWPSHANFVLVRIGSAHTEFVQALRVRGILVRDRSSDPGCEGCVRLTVGSAEHVQILIDALHVVVEEIGLHREVRA
jgi:histidinol-phosphate aminotransferase